MKFKDTPAGIHPLIGILDDVCANPYIYHFEEISLPCFFLQAGESRTYITEYIARRLMDANVLVPQSTCTSAVFTLEDTRDSTLGKLMYNIDQLAILDNPQGICIGITIKSAVTVNAKDENLSRFFSILAGYKKVCWVFYTDDMNLCNTRGITALLKDCFAPDFYSLCLDCYQPEQLAEILMNKLEELHITFTDYEEVFMLLEDMLEGCETVNQALGYVPALLKGARYKKQRMYISPENILASWEGKTV